MLGSLGMEKAGPQLAEKVVDLGLGIAPSLLLGKI